MTINIRAVQIQGVGYGARMLALQGFVIRADYLDSYQGGGGPIVRRRKTPVSVETARRHGDGDDDVLMFIL